MFKIILYGLLLTISLSADAKVQHNDLANPKAFNLLNVVLTKDKMADLNKKFGRAKTPKSTEKICIVGSDGTRVTFSSNFSFSGQEVAQYILERKGKGSDKNCTPSSQLSAKMKIPAGLWLGMKRSDVEAKLGKGPSQPAQFDIGSLKSNLYPYTFSSTSPGYDRNNPPPPSAGSSSSKSKLETSVNIYVGYDSNDQVDTLFVGFESEPTEI